MLDIKSYKFEENSIKEIRDYHYGKDWPVVYLIEGKQELYVGQSTNVYRRSTEHYKNESRKQLDRIHIITDGEYNMSAAFDIEAHLIEYIAADTKFKLQNATGGTRHNYYDSLKYKAKLNSIWGKLQEMGLAKLEIHEIVNSDIFKYSQYKALNEEQLTIADSIIEFTEKFSASTQMVSGKPGTGKTILAIYLMKKIISEKISTNESVGFVVPMASLRKTLKQVFRNVQGLKSSMVIGPNDVIKKNYDVLIVDESHRLQRRKGITNFGDFDKINKALGLGKEGTQLDWILQSAKKAILFYDAGQSVKPADVRPEDYHAIANAKKYELVSQMRVEGGERYLNFVSDLFDEDLEMKYEINNYDFRVFNKFYDMKTELNKKEKENGLARMVAGYAWEWKSKNEPENFDIEIEGIKIRWNSTPHNWVNSENAINEVGCIHTIQGYDLNYAAVIIGRDIKYNKKEGKIEIDRSNYFDKKGYYGIDDDTELDTYIKSIYKVLMTRGIKGTYLYIMDEDLREYMAEVINKVTCKK